MRFSKTISISFVVLALLSCTQIMSWKEVQAKELRLVHAEGLTYLDDALFTGNAVAYYDNGKKSEQVEYRKGKKKGVSRLWFKDGSISYVAYYRNNKLHGSVKTWWVNGNKRSHSNYKKGVVRGKQTEWYKSGPMYTIKHCKRQRNWTSAGLEGKWKAVLQLRSKEW
ncbi:MAG: hypothetical protein HRT57_04185 [Crocinitomicaceae bacterium]|nr:hypothetical protein [Crocinitomicaceae bacterium]